MFSGPIPPVDGANPALMTANAPGPAAHDFVLPPVASSTETTRGCFGYLSAEKPAPAPTAAALAQIAALFAADGGAQGFAPDPRAAGFLRFVGHDLALMPADATLNGDRAAAAAQLTNLRRGSIDLSSIYGPDDAPSPGLRDPAAPARMIEGVGAGTPSADPRNHLSPALSRTHRALLRLHNMAVEECDDPGVVAAGPDPLFAYARAEVRMLVQWLTMNRALPALCAKPALDAVADGRAPLFTRMVARMGGGVPPVPLEALVGALPLITLGAEERAAAPGDVAALLQLGRLVALPSGQETVRAINRALGTRIAPLTDAELCAGPAASMMTGAMLEHTPLWLYLLREAEERGQDGRLGPVGSHVAAQSVAGLIFSDPYAYWLRPGNTGGRWRPEDSVLRVGGRPVTSIAQLAAAAD